MLVRIPSVLDKEGLAECRRGLENGPWIDGSVSAGVLASEAKKNTELNQLDPLAQRLGELVVGSMMKTAAFQAAALPVRISPPSFSRYSDGQSYGMHNDAAILEFNVGGSRLLVRTDLAATLFLSAPDEYEGGETDFPMIGKRYKGHKGNAVFFWNVEPDGTPDKRTLHAGLPPTRGEKWLLSQWIRGPAVQV